MHVCKAKKNSWTKLTHLTIDHHLHCELLAPTDTPLAELHYLHIYAAALVMTSQWNIRETYREQLLLAALLWVCLVGRSGSVGQVSLSYTNEFNAMEECLA